MHNLLFVLSLIASSAIAGNCDSLYVTGKQFHVANTVELCNSFYAVAYSNVHKGPVVTFEKFDPAGDTPRVNVFRSDKRIPAHSRAELSDYVHSGYDRGHMTPAADASSTTEMRDTFLLSNMTPQAKKLNEGAWKTLEMSIRKTAKGVTFVATGAIYGNDVLGKNKIGIPVRYYKIVWYANHTQEAYYADNKNSAKIVKSTIAEVEKMSQTKFKY